MYKLSNKTSFGMTLIELMVTVTIAGILAIFAVPYMFAVQKKAAVGSESRSIATAFHFARSEAVTKKQYVNVVPTDGADWANGITVWTDDNGNSAMDSNSDEVLQLYDAINGASVTPTAGVLQVTFDRNGSMSAPRSAVTFTLQMDNCDSQIDGRVITVNSNGRVELASTPCV